MDRENPTWGEERIANELSLKLGITVSPRTVRKYLDSSRPRGTTGDQRWSTFVRNHARAVVACDFFISVTASFRILYVFVAMEIGSRWILHTNVTAHPTAEWMIQQFREFLAFDHPYQFVIHDRDRIFSPRLDQELKVSARVLKTPVRAPKANAFCERLTGTIRRECLDFLIPINERHCGRSSRSLSVITIAAGLTPRWDLEFRSHPRTKFRPAPIGMCFPPVTALSRRQFSVGCTTNIAWERRQLSGRPIFCGLQGCVSSSPATGSPSKAGQTTRKSTI